MFIYRRKSQSVLDFVLAFGALILLILGIARIWIWFNANYAKRTVDYYKERIAAGTPHSVYDQPRYKDKPLPLTEDWVFKGIPSGTVEPLPPGSEPPGIIPNPNTDDTAYKCAKCAACNSYTEAMAALRREAGVMRKQAEKLDDFVKNADDWYDPLYWVYKMIGIDIEAYKQASKDLKNAARETLTQVAKLQEKYNELGCPELAPECPNLDCS